MSIILQLVDSISWLRRVMFSDFVDLLSTVTNSKVMTFLEQRMCIFLTGVLCTWHPFDAKIVQQMLASFCNCSSLFESNLDT